MQSRLRSTALISAFGIVLLASLSCRNGARPVRECSNGVTLTVGSGASPVFSWTPKCTVGDIYVERVEPTGQRVLLWSVFDPHNELHPGIQYGSRGGPAPPLTAGSSYRARVGLVVGGDAVYTLDTRDFSR